MRFLLPGMAAFAVLLLTHLILWRLHRPRAEYAALVVLAAVVLSATLTLFAILQPAMATRPLDILTALVLYAGLFAAYFTTYSAVQADSPTMAMLLRIADAGRLGMTRAELLTVFDDDVLVMPRLADLVGGGFIEDDAGRYRIVARGRALVRPQLAFRRLLGMEKGG
jgi:hypothetical protein